MLRSIAIVRLRAEGNVAFQGQPHAVSTLSCSPPYSGGVAGGADNGSPPSELERQIAALRQGDHLCLIYDIAAEQMAAVIPFFTRGLEQGERCGYIADDRTIEEVTNALTAAGVEVAQEQGRGALLLLTKRDAYLRSGVFDPQQMISFLRQATEAALAAGFTGLRVTGAATGSSNMKRS